MPRILHYIACWVHWADGIPKIVFEFVEIQFAETNHELNKGRIIILDHEFQTQIL